MKDGKYPDWYIGAIGFLASYNGKFFGGRAGTVRTKINTIRNFFCFVYVINLSSPMFVFIVIYSKDIVVL